MKLNRNIIYKNNKKQERESYFGLLLCGILINLPLGFYKYQLRKQRNKNENY